MNMRVDSSSEVNRNFRIGCELRLRRIHRQTFHHAEDAADDE